MNKKSNRNGNGLLIAIIVLIVIAIAAGAAYYFLLRPVSPKDVFVEKISVAMNKANTTNTANANRINRTITLSGNIESTNPQVAQVAQIINQGKVSLNVQADMVAKKFLVGADVNYQNENLLNAKVFLQDGDNNGYLYVKDLLDKYFKVDMGSTGISSGEVTGVLTGVKDANTANKIMTDTLIENLKEEYFAKEEVDGLVKNTMKLSFVEIKTMITNIVTSLKNNPNYLNCFEKPEEITKSLDEVLEGFNDMDSKYASANVEVALYTKGNSKDAQKLEVKIATSETEGATFVLNKVDINKSEFNLEVKGVSNGMPVSVQALTGTISVEKSGNTAKYTVVVNNVPNVGKVTLNMELTESETTELDSVDVTNSVDVNNMTQLEQMTLYTNLTKMKIYPYIAPYMGIQN